MNNKKEHEVQQLLAEKSEFKKEIGVFGGVSIIGGIMIGSGIFYIGAYALQRSGMSMGLSLLAWIIGGVISLLGGLCFAELGAMMPKAGGMYVYLSRAYSPAVGFMNEFTSWLISGAGSNAAIALAFSTALAVLIPMGTITIKFVAILTIIILSGVNYRGVKQGSVIQNIFMIAKTIPLVLILVLGLFMGKQPLNLSLIPVSDPGLSRILGMIAFATIATLWAYDGWTNLNAVAEEIKNPKKNLPLSIIIAISSVTVLYVLFNFAIYRVLPADQINNMINNGDLYLGTKVAKVVLGSIGGIIVAVTMVISMIGSLNGCIMSFPREYYAMAHDNLFFKSFKKLHPKYKTPSTAIIVQMIISSLLVLLRDLNQLTSLVIFSSMTFKALTIGAVIVFRKKLPNIERPYKVWGGLTTVVITILVMVGLIINTLINDPTTSLVGLVVPAVGYLFYRYFKARNQKGMEHNA
ncbi:APC family permease [Sediminispirochaeta smaragdinae]|uniref:Amino acid permease-associated region n=1 Tax=Sediminispirochaeta smaragdinae (strain DSM 11293 / JCM 15392 / SEBR 4228) TaxID=573413 RepID=E1R8S3_SEDSS|nr:amino acid permease [Sediminispirochaeta smaragdinae]ADK81830.1 amino acid permease-associated region [Sediminispirochaeta smaragdinae DSM 11293]